MKHLKIISIYKNEKALIRQAASGSQQAQKRIFDKYSPKMLGLCRQYIRDLQYAEDVMVRGFVKVFKNLNSYRFEGSFEGWIRRIMVNEALSFLRKKQFVVFDEELYEQGESFAIPFSSSLDVEHIQEWIDSLPEGYKTVFLLYAIEGYKHAEIAEMLQISESTSKSQLYKARKLLQAKAKSQNIVGYGTL